MRSSGTGSHGILHRATIGRCLYAILINMHPYMAGIVPMPCPKDILPPTVPEAWTIYEDRLYLNFSLRARELWLQDVPGNIALGDANWPKLKKKKRATGPL